MSYYLFNKQEILEKQRKDIQKKKLLNIIYKNKQAKNCYKNLSEEEKKTKLKSQKKRYQELLQHKKEALERK